MSPSPDTSVGLKHANASAWAFLLVDVPSEIVSVPPPRVVTSTSESSNKQRRKLLIAGSSAEPDDGCVRSHPEHGGAGGCPHEGQATRGGWQLGHERGLPAEKVLKDLVPVSLCKRLLVVMAEKTRGMSPPR